MNYLVKLSINNNSIFYYKSFILLKSFLIINI